MARNNENTKEREFRAQFLLQLEGMRKRLVRMLRKVCRCNCRKLRGFYYRVYRPHKIKNKKLKDVNLLRASTLTIIKVTVDLKGYSFI